MSVLQCYSVKSGVLPYIMKSTFGGIWGIISFLTPCSPCTDLTDCQIILRTLGLKINESECYARDYESAYNTIWPLLLCYCVCTAVWLNDLPLYCTHGCDKSWSWRVSGSAIIKLSKQRAHWEEDHIIFIPIKEEINLYCIIKLATEISLFPLQFSGTWCFV